MSLRGLAGKVAVVTGAAQGIGAATVDRLLEEGCRIVALDINETSLARYAGNANVAIGAVDIAKEADCTRGVQLGVERFGAVHLMANCAAIVDAIAPLAQMDVDAFDRVMAVNVRGTMLMMRATLQQMIAQKLGGSIVCIASIAVIRGGPTRSAYGASKRAVLGLTTTAALENGQYGIRVNAVAPGLIDTPMLHGLDAVALVALNASLASRPITRLGRPQEIAALIAWLLSEESSYVTGSLQLADGGFTL